MQKCEHIDPREIFIGYEAVTTGLLGPSGSPMVKGYKGTICVGAGNNQHKVVMRTPEENEQGLSMLTDGPVDAMLFLARAMPVVGLKYDPSIWHHLPSEIRPSIVDPGQQTRDIYWFPFLDEYVAERKAALHEAEAQHLRKIMRGKH